MLPATDLASVKLGFAADDPFRTRPPASAMACRTRCRYFRPRLLPRERILPSFGSNLSFARYGQGSPAMQTIQASDKPRARGWTQGVSTAYRESKAYMKDSSDPAITISKRKDVQGTNDIVARARPIRFHLAIYANYD